MLPSDGADEQVVRRATSALSCFPGGPLLPTPSTFCCTWCWGLLWWEGKGWGGVSRTGRRMRAPSVWLTGVIRQQQVSPLHTGGWNWAWWHRMSHHAATWDLYPRGLGSQEGFQEECDMVTLCFGAISQMQCTEREGKDWSGAGGGWKEAWKPARRRAKGQPGLDINPLTEFTSVWAKPDAEILKERASHRVQGLGYNGAAGARPFRCPTPSRPRPRQGSLLPFETPLPPRTQSQGFMPPGLALQGGPVLSLCSHSPRFTCSAPFKAHEEDSLEGAPPDSHLLSVGWTRHHLRAEVSKGVWLGSWTPSLSGSEDRQLQCRVLP